MVSSVPLKRGLCLRHLRLTHLKSRGGHLWYLTLMLCEIWSNDRGPLKRQNVSIYRQDRLPLV